MQEMTEMSGGQSYPQSDLLQSTSIKNGSITPKPPPKSNGVWLYLIGFLTGILATFMITILVGWIVDSAFPHSSWLNKGFYGYVVGCETNSKQVSSSTSN